MDSESDDGSTQSDESWTNNSVYEVIGLLDWTCEDGNVFHCAAALCNLQCLQLLCKLLAREKLLQNFMFLIGLLLNGQLPVCNLPFLLCLERARFQSVSSSTLMRFREDTKQFWATVLLIGKGKILHLFSGKKSLGNVSNAVDLKGSFKPGNASVNFIVPSRKILRKCLKDVPRKVKPGFIEQTSDMLNLNHQHVLMFDAKKISSGLGPFPTGDVNFGGLEGPPNLDEQKFEHSENIEFCSIIESEIANMNNNLSAAAKVRCFDALLKINRRITVVAQKIFDYVASCKKRVAKLESYTDTRKPDRYKFAISNEKGNILLSRRWLKQMVSILGEMGTVVASIKGNSHLVCDAEEVELKNCANYRPLHDVEIIMKSTSVQISTKIVKQRSDMWFQIRNTAHITGSSAWNALGLRGLKEYRQHYKKFILHQQPPKVPSIVQTRMDFGTQNEIHGIATCISFCMPNLLPSCYIYKEQGCYMIDGDERSDMACVSPDGILVCSHNEDNNSSSLIHSRHKPIVLEVKCPYPRPNDGPNLFKIPIYYSIQLLLEMKVTGCTKCWYLAFSKHTSVLHEVQFDNALCEEVMQCIAELYDTEQPIQLQRIPDHILSLKSKCEKYLEKNSTIILCCPSKKAIIDTCNCENVSCAHHIYSPPLTVEDVDEEFFLMGLESSCKALFREGFNILRQKGHEVLSAVICNTSRLYDPHIPSNMPIWYGLKGFSLNVEKMREIVELTRNKCHEKKIDILCEAYDGQWAGLVFNDIANKPLTRFQLHSKCWHKSLAIGKKKLLEELASYGNVNAEDLDFWSHTQFLIAGYLEHGNIAVNLALRVVDGRMRKGALTLGSVKKNLAGNKIYGLVRTPDFSETPRAWEQPRSLKRQSVALQKQLMVDIDDIVQYLPDYIWQNTSFTQFSDVDHSTHEGSIITSKESSTAGQQDDNTTSVATGPRNNILQDILVALRRSKHARKYTLLSEEELFFQILSDKSSLASNMTVLELDLVAAVITKYTSKPVYKKSSSKVEKINALGRLFGDEEQWVGKCRKKRHPKTLSQLAKDVIMSPQYPKTVLASVHASIAYIDHIKEWENRSTVPMSVEIPGSDSTFELFCFPEYSASRDQLEPRIIDPTHILNNVRSKICRSGIEPFPKRVVNVLAKSRDRFISSLMISKILDQQNAQISLDFFSEHMENTLHMMGEYEAENFVRIFRNWYEGCDSRGISPENRIESFVEIHKYFTDNISLHKFPGIGRYIKGIPRITVESILHNSSMRIILYRLAKDNTYCQRAISTLGIEWFFSLLAYLDFQNQNCPKASHLEYLLSQVVCFNHIINNPDKNWNFDKRRGLKYPSEMLMNKLRQCQHNEHPIYKYHLFDVAEDDAPTQRKKSAQLQRDIRAQETGESGIRRHHYKIVSSAFSIIDKIGNYSDSDVSDFDH